MRILDKEIDEKIKRYTNLYHFAEPKRTIKYRNIFLKINYLSMQFGGQTLFQAQRETNTKKRQHFSCTINGL